MQTDEISADLKLALNAELRDSEAILWTRQPAPGRAALGATIFAAFICGAACGVSKLVGQYLQANVLHRAPHFQSAGAAYFAVLAPILLSILVGAIFGRFIGTDRAKRTIYAVTAQRLIVLTLSSPNIVGSYAASDILSVHREAQKRGLSDINVTLHPKPRSTGAVICLYGLPDAEEAERVLGLLA